MAVELEKEEVEEEDTTVSQRWIGADSAGIRMTPEEFDAIEDWDDDYRYELIHGVLVVSPPASNIEVDLSLELVHWLRNYNDTVKPNPIDKVLVERYVRLPDSRRRPDGTMWIGLGRVPDEKTDMPTIAIEFVSPGKRAWRRDYIEKRAECLAGGMKEYWVVDRFTRSMTVFTHPAGKPAEIAIAEKDVYRTDLLPGFELSLSKLMALADTWTAAAKKSKGTASHGG